MPPAMRVSNHRARGNLALASVLSLSAILAACGSNQPAASIAAASTTAPTPVITPDPHLTDPATADQIFNAIRGGDLALSVNNATAGTANAPLIKQINAQIANWPLIISEYRTAALLRKQLGWPASGVKQGDPPFTWVGMNIVVTFGPTTGTPVAPDPTRQQQAKDVVALIDPLLWPLEQRALTPIATKTPPPAATAPPPASAGPASAAP
jgi:hypothetical protein